MHNFINPVRASVAMAALALTLSACVPDTPPAPDQAALCRTDAAVSRAAVASFESANGRPPVAMTDLVPAFLQAPPTLVTITFAVGATEPVYQWAPPCWDAAAAGTLPATP